MASPPRKKDKRKTKGANSLFDILPDVNLIDEKQWQYIQRRYHLSPRELEVAKLVCTGLTNIEIASVLKVKLGTVKTHLKKIFSKVRTRSKITLLIRFIGDVNAFFDDSASVPPIRIVDAGKPGKKTTARTETSEKDQ